MTATPTDSMLADVGRNWWALLLRGILAVLFGLIALFWPGITITVLVLFFGAYALVDGIFAVVAGIRGTGGSRWVLIVEGVLGAWPASSRWPGRASPRSCCCTS
jgi:uncharacterized membrane protein HdeD (DUF308 family)